eukprot:CAMPEP_0181200372 /NCGR_PEP_ID=MMETSP1096-20121128/17726_1 /TAXON_ID=156174 ORGANISM="Chrysochromulina ericina, Strain CCMP281" /NCGR_SAMPLE_ID=MMETSP1096 /ASSEMBLY_ACC=CAM_ASM_000453 /LENGTH=168 /DNA_ID=CAMNT_0023290719 /DNA_START=57 /DNA_END=560 /DNA_ORIENTATION=+
MQMADGPNTPATPSASDDATELPPNIAARTSFQTGGYRNANHKEECLILWNTFRKCYPTEEMAVTAVNKNSAVILPNLNSPSKITGTHSLLVERFGQDGATEIIVKNPGVLVCTPASLESQSDEDIVNAANLVSNLENNKESIKLFILANFFAFPALVLWQVGVNRGW